MPSSSPLKMLANPPLRPTNQHQLCPPTAHPIMLSKEAWEVSVALVEWADSEVWEDSEEWAAWAEWVDWVDWVEWTHK